MSMSGAEERAQQQDEDREDDEEDERHEEERVRADGRAQVVLLRGRPADEDRVAPAARSCRREGARSAANPLR